MSINIEEKRSTLFYSLDIFKITIKELVALNKNCIKKRGRQDTRYWNILQGRINNF